MADEVIAGAAPDERGRHTRTVVLLHGLARGARHAHPRVATRGAGLPGLQPRLRQRVADFDHALDAVRRSLLARVPSSGRIDFVTHSLGGLRAARTAGSPSGAPAGRGASPVSPNGGSEIADRLASVLLARVIGPRPVISGRACTDPALRRLLGLPIPVGVIAGSR
ncbi:MAG: hypothetical protein R3E53_20015 [Myxococcota bacterium]